MSEKLLVETDEYLKSGAHIGTKFKSGDMGRYIYKSRKDGLNVLDIQTLDQRIRIAARFLASFDLSKIVAVSRKLYGQMPVKEFANSIGGIALTGRFVPGTFTNPQGKGFIEPAVVIVTEPESDGQSLREASSVCVPVVAMCSTNNLLRNVDLVIPINNKGKKSLALVYWLLAREILKAKGEIKSDTAFSKKIEDFEYKLKEGEKEADSTEKKAFARFRPRRYGQRRSY